jgi:hypothetical protein
MIISHAIDKYLQRVKSRSVATERTYATGLRRFQEYIDERGLPSESTDVAALTPPVFQDYIAWLDEYLLRGVAEGDKRHVSQSTKKTYLAAVLGFLDYLVVGTQLVERQPDAVPGQSTLGRDRAGASRPGEAASEAATPFRRNQNTQAEAHPPTESGHRRGSRKLGNACGRACGARSRAPPA